MTTQQQDDDARLARRLMRQTAMASLATTAAEDGHPYVSLVQVAADHDASPILLLSGLAAHTANIAEDPRAALLCDGTGGLDAPLSGPRLSVLGRLIRDDTARLRQRYLARHPDAAGYAGFADFAIYRLAVERAHLVAGFGRIVWLPADVLLDRAHAGACEDWEGAVVEHMNADHGDAVDLYATVLLGADGTGWRITGCDADGCDLRRGGTVLRLDFAAPVRTAGEARAELVRLVSQARAAAANGATIR